MIDPQEKVSVELTVGQLLHVLFVTRNAGMNDVREVYRYAQSSVPVTYGTYSGLSREALESFAEVRGSKGFFPTAHQPFTSAFRDLVDTGAFDPDPVEPEYGVRFGLRGYTEEHVLQERPENYRLYTYGPPARFVSHAEAYCAISNALALQEDPGLYINFRVVEVTP